MATTIKNLISTDSPVIQGTHYNHKNSDSTKLFKNMTFKT